MLDARLKDLIPITTVPDHLPCRAGGRRYHPSTASRWALYGLHGTRLASVKLGGKRFTKTEWLARFLEECDSCRVDSQACREEPSGSSLEVQS